MTEKPRFDDGEDTLNVVLKANRLEQLCEMLKSTELEREAFADELQAIEELCDCYGESDALGAVKIKILELEAERDKWHATAEARLQKIEDFGAKLEAAYTEIDQLKNPEPAKQVAREYVPKHARMTPMDVDARRADRANFSSYASRIRD